jgi:translation elongation factor EF-G
MAASSMGLIQALYVHENAAVDDVRVELYEGSYHDIDSSEGAFRIAGALAFQDAAKRAGPVLLEPVMRVQVIAPEPHAATVKQDLASRRARWLSHSEHGGTATFNARVPLAEMFGYSTWLRDATVGRGAFDMRFESYEHVEHDGRGGDLQPMPVAPTRPGPTLGPLKAEAAEPEDDGGAP